MPKVDVACDGCGKSLNRWPSEIGRRGGGTFCDRSCAAKTGNAPRRSKEIVMDCPCGKRFKTTTHNKAKRHCSRSCASRFSMSDKRREAQREAGLLHKTNLSPAKALKEREGWKYAALRESLAGREFEFEFELNGRIFDLALLDTKTLVEFDGPDHAAKNVREDDAAKDQVAEAAGFIVIRRPLIPSTVISPTSIEGL